MEQQRFDNVARAFAGSRSRRQVLRSLVGTVAASVLAVARGGRVEAQQQPGPGQVCSVDLPCFQTLYGGPVTCADNGTTSDGTLHCCLPLGGGCNDDASCCGAYTCLNTRCGGVFTSASELWPGAACTASDHCFQYPEPIYCADNGIADDGEFNCCRYEGGRCSDEVSSADCCAGLACQNGVCTAPSYSAPIDGSCTPPGGNCNAAYFCCSGVCIPGEPVGTGSFAIYGPSYCL